MKPIPSYVVTVSAALALAALTAEPSAHAQTLEERVAKLEATLEGRVAALEATVDTLQKQLASAQHVLALDPFVSVDPNPEVGVAGPNIIFTGANIHIVSGSGMTNDNGNPRGLGNLIIGYDEAPAGGGGVPPHPVDRGGSHNLIIGLGNSFTTEAFGGLVAGEQNTISAEATSILGGGRNTATAGFTSILGGVLNTASAINAVVTGGNLNTASGEGAVVLGGFSNTASGFEAVVLGGESNTVSGGLAVVLGGRDVIGGADDSIRPQPPFNP